MKKSAAIASMLFMALGAFGCSQDKEQKSQVNYTPATAPTTMMQVDQMQEAAKMAPKDAQAWINLGNAFMDAQRFGEAVDAYQKALALDPKNVNVIVDMGTCYRGTGKFDKAVEHSLLDGTKLEDRARHRADDLNDAAKRLRDVYGDKRDKNNPAVRDQVDKTIAAASDLNRIMGEHRFTDRVQRNWDLLKSDLDALAQVYDLPSL